MKEFNGKKVWIIGASTGIGRALAEELHARGAILILSARSHESLKDLNFSMGGSHQVLSLDVSDADQFANCFTRLSTKIDSVIYLAATYTPANIENISKENLEDTLSINIEGAFNLLRYLIPFYKKQGFGQIALCGSVAGYVGLPGGQPYSASKAALINLAESLHAEVKEHNIDVRLISPGFVKTRLTNKNDFSMPMIITSEQAAREIADGLLKNNFEIHFPKKFTLLIKIIRLLPYGLYFFLSHKLRR